ncbi:uncharacterized protein LOC125833495 [Solanum verrucosum]|uniref:uncharacterized protein LOC125833495 n=1 Tax=Solanum verrucosum TaxID=315347 RepID=UPI0020D155BB|nr:uncharacterized protein LOC125833495 [Solanum verrucosum]
MDVGDKSWMDLRRSTDEYTHGVNDFLDKAFERASQEDEILCPCKKCFNCYWHCRNVVEDHLICHGLVHGYTKWVFHGEGFSSRNIPHPTNDNENFDRQDGIDKLLQDTFRNVTDDLRHEGVRKGLSEDAKRFFKLVEEGKQELYPGCKNVSKLNFTIRLYLFKCIHKLSNVAFSDLLDLIKEAFPFAQIHESFYKEKKVIKDLGLHYEKIHATKVLRYFSLKPRLQRICMCSETSIAMRWHDTERPKDGNLRHPADGEAWKDFDSLHPDFASDAHNVRLGLSSDGFNPFRTMSISHSTWPVMLMNYSLSLWICMKPEVEGTMGSGVETYDIVTNQAFMMRAALLWTISDFPALAMLSRWSTKGKWARPTCNHNSYSQYLKHSHKMCYLGHRAFFPHDHPYRRDKKSFNGKEEHKVAPTPLSGVQVLEELREFNNVFGKGQKKRKRKNDSPWKKNPYFLSCRIGQQTN